MTLDNFEKTFPANRLKNGLSYFKKGHVINLEQNEDGDWSAIVIGSEEYDVEIIMDRHRINETTCSCPSHDEDDLCKHVAAVLYAISHELDGDDEEEEKTELPDNINSMLEELRHSELQTILRVQMRGNKDLMTAFETSAEFMLLCRDTDDLRTELGKKIEAFADGGDIERKSIPAVVELADSFLDTAVTHLKKKQIKQAVDHVLAVIDALTIQSEYMDDKEGLHRKVIARGLQLVDEILSTEKIDEPIMRLLQARISSNAEMDNLPIAHYDLHWLDIIVKHELAKDEVEEFLEFLDQQVKDNMGNSAAHARLLRLKIDFLGNNGHKRAAIKLIENNPDIANDKEQLILSASKKNGEYKIIKEKLLAELELARSNGDKQQYADLQKSIIELMETKSDVLDLRRLAEQFYRETGNMHFFEAMKGTYMNAEWEQVKGRFVNPLRKA